MRHARYRDGDRLVLRPSAPMDAALSEFCAAVQQARFTGRLRFPLPDATRRELGDRLAACVLAGASGRELLAAGWCSTASIDPSVAGRLIMDALDAHPERGMLCARLVRADRGVSC